MHLQVASTYFQNTSTWAMNGRAQAQFESISFATKQSLFCAFFVSETHICVVSKLVKFPTVLGRMMKAWSGAEECTGHCRVTQNFSKVGLGKTIVVLPDSWWKWSSLFQCVQICDCCAQLCWTTAGVGGSTQVATAVVFCALQPRWTAAWLD